MVSGQNNILEGPASEWGSMIVCFRRSLRLASTRCLGLPELLLSAEAGGSWGGSHWWAAWAGVSLLWVPGQVLPILLPLPGPWDAGWVCDTAWLQHELLCRRTAVLWAGNRILLSWVSEGCAFGPVHASLGMHPACSRAGLVNVGSTAAKEKGERLLFGWVGWHFVTSSRWKMGLKEHFCVVYMYCWHAESYAVAMQLHRNVLFWGAKCLLPEIFFF